jgi:hypothetical protein
VTLGQLHISYNSPFSDILLLSVYFMKQQTFISCRMLIQANEF